MRLVFAFSPATQYFNLLNKCGVENILISYNFIKDVDRLITMMNGYVPKTFMLDSGAFSVWSQGRSIDIDAYKSFAVTLREKLDPSIELNVVNLDVLPGKFGQTPTQHEREQSAIDGFNNMLTLKREGLKVIHVYHQHENIAWLDKIREHLPYIGISPANDVSMKEKLAFMDSCYARITTTVKTHGFAVTSPKQLYRYPLYSADSSSFLAAGRFGRIPLFYDDLSIKSLDYKDKQDVLKHWDYIKHIGIEKLGADSWHDRTELSIRTYLELERVATKLWKSRGVDWSVDN
jgi:hypothetical protein